MSRYYVDERVGCVAIRDNMQTKSEGNTLHEDIPDVVRFWNGEHHISKCPHCGSNRDSEWYMPPSTLKRANDLCNELNEREEKMSKTLFQELMSAINDVVMSADDAGCDENLTVIDNKALDRLECICWECEKVTVTMNTEDEQKALENLRKNDIID